MSDEIRFLTVEIVIKAHRQQIERFGGLDGLRDAGLLDAAVAMPKARFGGQFLHESIPAMAAAYLFHLCQAHAFVDGNKRVALHAADVFIRDNGYHLDAPHEAILNLVLDVASGKASKAKVTTFFEEHCRPVRGKGAKPRKRS